MASIRASRLSQGSCCGGCYFFIEANKEWPCELELAPNWQGTCSDKLQINKEGDVLIFPDRATMESYAKQHLEPSS